VANKGSQGEPYVRSSLENVKSLVAEGGVKELCDKKSIEKEVGTGGGSGDWGYINHRSGWADAEAGMVILRKLVEATNRVTFLTREAISLLYSNQKVIGARFSDGSTFVPPPLSFF
jgi:sarcosine oxidase/L-pipecolate oxidase